MFGSWPINWNDSTPPDPDVARNAKWRAKLKSGGFRAIDEPIDLTPKPEADVIAKTPHALDILFNKGGKVRT